jgi:ubiquinone/menaquinone biosynthesis C-methylase UbiE
MMHNEREEFWKLRAKNYQRLEWAIKGEYLHAFLDADNFNSKDVVLDIGTGTGIIAHTISPFVKKVIGIDISPDMLSRAIENKVGNEEFVQMDTCKLQFEDQSFTKVTARMVFHHILEDIQKAMDECYRVIRKGGKIVFSEGVPPSEHVKPFYTEMFKFKEERLTFMDNDLLTLLRRSGFTNIKESIFWMTQASIKNWLDNSGLESKTQVEIMQMHRDLDKKGKEDYNMRETEDDCFIDMKFVILVGERA